MGASGIAPGATRRNTTTAAKLTALTNASKHEFPTGDIGEMLHDIAAGQRLA